MNRIRTFIILLTIILILSGVAASQNRARSRSRALRAAPTPLPTPLPARRPVTINLKQGEAIHGYFLRADADVVLVELKRGNMTIKLSDIDSLLFAPQPVPAAKPREETPPAPAPTVQDPVLPNARMAYTALRKLADAAQLGLPYLQYANLLIETRPVVDQALAALPEGAVKAEVAAAMEAYTDAGQAWSAGMAKGGLPIAIEPGATLMKKYAIKPAVNALGQEDHLPLDVTLSAIWTAANSHINNLASFLK